MGSFAGSSAMRELQGELRIREAGGKKEGGERHKREEQWTTTWWEQFAVLLQRGMKERRHEALSVLRISQVAASALLAGLLWWRSGNHLQDQVTKKNPNNLSFNLIFLLLHRVDMCGKTLISFSDFRFLGLHEL